MTEEQAQKIDIESYRASAFVILGQQGVVVGLSWSDHVGPDETALLLMATVSTISHHHARAVLMDTFKQDPTLLYWRDLLPCTDEPRFFRSRIPHYHSSLALFTPADVHPGRVDAHASALGTPAGGPGCDTIGDIGYVARDGGLRVVFRPPPLIVKDRP
jgi:hypothetical protein